MHINSTFSLCESEFYYRYKVRPETNNQKVAHGLQGPQKGHDHLAYNNISTSVPFCIQLKKMFTYESHITTHV
jgi:hypothetical protein